MGQLRIMIDSKRTRTQTLKEEIKYYTTLRSEASKKKDRLSHRIPTY